MDKFAQAIQEILSYKRDEMNADTSVGMRISFYRFACFYYLQSPIAGWGDSGWMKRMNSPELLVFTTHLFVTGMTTEVTNLVFFAHSLALA